MTRGTSSGTLPPCIVARGGRVSLTPNRWLSWHPDSDVKAERLPPEWVLRQLQTVDLDDPLWLLTVLDLRGMVWSPAERLRNPAETPEELAPAVRPRKDDLYATVHLGDVHALLTALRDAGAQWLAHVRDETPLPASFDWLLHVGTSQFSHVLVDRSDQLEGDLFEAGCWQLYGITRDTAPVKRCQNERCGRVYYRQDHRTRYGQSLATGTKYCSTQCREAQKKRVQRRLTHELIQMSR
jgi:hypothetical protein